MGLFYRVSERGSNGCLRRAREECRRSRFLFAKVTVQPGLYPVEEQAKATAPIGRHKSDVSRRCPRPLHDSPCFVEISDESAVVLPQEVHLVQGKERRATADAQLCQGGVHGLRLLPGVG